MLDDRTPRNRNSKYGEGQAGRLAPSITYANTEVIIVALCPGIEEPGYTVQHKGSKVQQWVRQSELLDVREASQ